MNSGPVVLQMIECQMFPSCEESAGENYGTDWGGGGCR